MRKQQPIVPSAPARPMMDRAAYDSLVEMIRRDTAPHFVLSAPLRDIQHVWCAACGRQWPCDMAKLRLRMEHGKNDDWEPLILKAAPRLSGEGEQHD